MPVALVTGCSSGIGLALARRLRDGPWKDGGYRAVVTARRSSFTRLAEEGLEDSASMLVRPLDVTAGEERRAVVEEATGRWGGVDVLVNNAGISYRGVVEDMGNDEELEQQQVNYLGAMALVRLVLPHMRRQRWGRILNVSSVGGMMAMPTMSSYSASKFALEGASESLWYEMKPWGVRVSLIRPGFIHSDSFRHVVSPAERATRRQDGTREEDPYDAYYRQMGSFIKKLMERARATPEDVAVKILATAARRRPPLRVAATVDARAFYLLRRILPRRLYHALLYRSLPGVRGWVRRG